MKIDSEGNFLRYCGYSIIYKLQYPQYFKTLEDFLKKTKFISPISTNNIHMTLFNIWSYPNKPIKSLNKYIIKEEFDFFTKHNLILPLNYLYEEHLLAMNKCLKNNSPIQPIKIKLVLNNSILKCLLIFPHSKMEILKSLVESFTKIYQKKDLFIPHITLGYVYKNFVRDDLLQKSLYDLEQEMNKNLDKFSLCNLDVYIFTNMDKFISLSDIYLKIEKF